MGVPDISDDEPPPKPTKVKKKKANKDKHGTEGAGTGSDAWTPAPLPSELPAPAAAALGSFQVPQPVLQRAPTHEQLWEPPVLQTMQAQLERILLHQEQMLAASEMQVQLEERLVKGQDDMQKTLSKLVSSVNNVANVASTRRVRKSDQEEKQRESIHVASTTHPNKSMFWPRITSHQPRPLLQKSMTARTSGMATVATSATEGTRASAMERQKIIDAFEQAEVDELKKVFMKADHDTIEMTKAKSMTSVQKIQKMSVHGRANLVDLFMGGVICFNMVVIGYSMDTETNPASLAVDTVLSIIFLWEMITKVYLFGFAGHFCPPALHEKLMTWNDTAIVFVDLSQLIVEFATLGSEESSSSNMRTSLLRIFRLARLTRIIRLLRLEAFHDLITMITGLAVGMPVLAWSVVLLFITLYIVALLGRLALGAGGPMEIRQEFDTVGGALFATFRCCFGDCTTRTGVSLLGMVIDEYGALTGIISALIIFFVTIGIFNVISAIFVEGTLSARMNAAEEKKKERLNNYSRFSANMKTLIERCCEVALIDPPCFSLDLIDEWSKVEITTADFKECCIHDEIVRGALRELEISEGDLENLADILDPQNDLVLTLVEILVGIKRLRGDPRRSDIVNVDFMIRDIQKSIGEIKDRLD